MEEAKREIKELKKENQKNRELSDQRNKLKKKLEEQEKYSKDLKTKNELLKSELQIMKSIRDKRLVNSQSYSQTIHKPFSHSWFTNSYSLVHFPIRGWFIFSFVGSQTIHKPFTKPFTNHFLIRPTISHSQKIILSAKLKALTKDHKEESPHQDKIRKRGKDRRRRKEHGEGKDHGLEHNSLY